MNKPTLSVALITLNEERIIGATLEAVKEISDEIIVVDSGSSDKTVKLAKSLGADVFTEDWKGFSEQKNSALGKCKSDWILSLDADEVITRELADEIVEAITSNGKVQGFKVAREFYLGNRRIRHGGYFPDYQLRLIRNGIGAEFGKRAVHESINMEGPVDHLKHPLKHFAYEDIGQYKRALKTYAKLAQKEIDSKALRFPNTRAAWAFVYRYFFRLGFLDGKLGLDLAKAYFHYVRDKYSAS